MQMNQQKTSIIILAHDQLEYTKQCVASIRRHTQKDTYELILIDNGSTDGTTNWLKRQEDIIGIFNDKNYGFPKGCNQGIKVASGTEILLLNNDTIVTPRWLEQLNTALYSDEKIGVVGCVTNHCSNEQEVEITYQSTEGLQGFADNFNKSDRIKWESRLRLVGFCYLIKGVVAAQVGLLDERFTPGMFEDDDYSLRVLEAGYKLLLCKDTFIHHYGSVSFKADIEQSNQLLSINLQKFTDKWGFSFPYYCGVRDDLIGMMTPKRKMNILEVGCACGGTLLKLKDIYPEARVYGIEKNEKVAAIANHFAEVISMDIESAEMPFEKGFFDYIIFGDVLEHLYDPQAVLEKMHAYLKEDGAVIASIPNVMHWSVVKELLAGYWSYRDAGILDRTHLRFFTLHEIVKMFNNAGYEGKDFNAGVIKMSPEDEEKFLFLQQQGWIKDMQHLDVFQWLVKADKVPVHSADAVAEIKESDRREIVFLLRRLENDIAPEENGVQVLAMLNDVKMPMQSLVELIENNLINKTKVIILLATFMYQHSLQTDMFNLLISAYKQYPSDAELIYTLAFFLDLTGSRDDAIKLLRNVKTEEPKIKELLTELTQ